MATVPEVKIEKGIPLPSRGGANGNAKYPWRTMEVGDSFLVPAKTPRKFSAHMAQAQRNTGHKFASRTVEGGCRVWRTA